MNAVAQTFAVAFASVAAAAAVGVGLANGMAEPATDMVKLERVVVVAKRADVTVVAQLPRVVIEGRRDVTMAAAKPATKAA